MHNLDPSSETSRYWESDESAQLHTLKQLNIGEFMIVCDDGAAVLSGAEDMLDDYAQMEGELLADFLADMGDEY